VVLVEYHAGSFVRSFVVALLGRSPLTRNVDRACEQCVASGPNHDYQDDPSGQFAWLQQVCTEVRAAKRALLVATNIAPGVSVTYEPLWLPQYETQWLSLLQQVRHFINATRSARSLMIVVCLSVSPAECRCRRRYRGEQLVPGHVLAVLRR